MTDMDVSLRVRLQNQVSRESGEVKRDLKELKDAAEGLGRAKGGDALAKDLQSIGRSADQAKGKLGEIDQQATSTRLAISRIGEGFGNFKGDAQGAVAALGKVKQQADETRAAIGRIDDGAFSGLKSDAQAAEQAITGIGRAADATQGKLRGMHLTGTNAQASGAPYRTNGPVRPGGGLLSTVEGAVDQFGLPVAIGAGVGYAAGALPATALVAAGAAVNAAAGDEQRSDALRASGGYDEREQRKFDQQMGRSGAKHGVGTEAAQRVFGVLQAGGLSSADAAAMTDNVVKFSVGTKADTGDAANLTIALRSIMGIGSDKMMSAYDTIATGGNNGKFEIPDMARNFPSILARMAARGSTGLQGVRTATAMSQPIARVSGSNDEAATAFEAMLDDLGATDVRDRAKKYGFDPILEMDAAKARGEDPVLGVLKRIREVFGKNRDGFADVFKNMTAVPAYRAIMDNIGEIEQLVDKMDGASGVVDEGYDVNTGNLNSQKDRMLSHAAKRLKDMAAPLLPLLTRVARDAANAMERQDVEGDKKQNQDELFKVLFSQFPKKEKVSPWRKFLFGAGAEPDFNLKEHMGINLRGEAESSMQGYAQGIASAGPQALQEAQSIADQLRAIFNFNISPTITPRMAPGPNGASPASAASGKQSSLQQSSNIRLTQNISSPNAKSAAMRAQREQARSIRQAQARTLYDTGRRLA